MLLDFFVSNLYYFSFIPKYFLEFQHSDLILIPRKVVEISGIQVFWNQFDYWFKSVEFEGLQVFFNLYTIFSSYYSSIINYF